MPWYTTIDFQVMDRVEEQLEERPLVVRGVAVVAPRELRRGLAIDDAQVLASLALLAEGKFIQMKPLDGGRYLWVSRVS
jgi:hypothetical protein